MRTIYFEEMVQLRTNPQLYWESEKDEPNNIEALFEVLIKDPSLFNDYFVIPKIAPNLPGVKMQETFAELFLNHTKEHGEEVDAEDVDRMIRVAKKAEGLKEEFVPSNEVIEYGQYLLIVNDKTKVTEEERKKVENYIKIAEAKGWLIRDYGNRQKATKHENPIYSDFFPGGWYEGGPYNFAQGFSLEHVSDKLGVSFMVHSAMWREGEILIKNFSFYDDIYTFPKYYKEKKLDWLASLQKEKFSSIFNSVKVEFIVINDTQSQMFTIENFPNVRDEKILAKRTYENRWKKPVEYMENQIKL